MPDVAAARRTLEAALGADRVLSDPLARRLYARDASMVEGSCELVAFPTSSGDVVTCVRAAAASDLAVVPRGSGTGLAGAATPIGDALVVVTTKMTRILEVRPEDRLAWVEPGVPNLDLATALRPLGFTFAPDPSSQQTSSIGGNVSTNAGGPHCLAYGVTSAHVLALDVVLPSGEVVRVGSEAPEFDGLDLRGVVVGSEGTLGIVTAVCVRLTPLPAAVRTMLLDFTTVDDCAATVTEIIARGVVPAAVEMMDHGIVVAAERFAHAGYPTDAAAILIVEVDGTRAAVEAQAAEVEAAAAANAVRTIRVAADDAERALLWKGRKSAFGAVAQIAPHYHLHDCVVPRGALVDVLAGVYEICRRHDLVVTNVFHAGDGNLHPLISFDRAVPGTLERVLAASEEIVRLCVDAGGALSGEHGIGVEKRDFMPLVFTPEDLAAQACVRTAFDPRGMMNPEKVLPAGARCGDPAGGIVDLIHPATIGEVASTLRAATAHRRRIRIVGGRTHAGRAAPREVDAELWTTQLDRTVAYDPAEMIAVVEAGMRVGELQRVLREGGQEWPVDAPADATVGGVVAAGVSGLRRLRVGHVRDTVVELELVTGDGRLVRSGARTVKNVTGFDIHRLATGSFGALGAIVRIALKVRPVPQAVRTVVHTGGGGIDLGRELLHAVPAAAAVLAGPDRIEVRLEGWAAEVDELAGAARSVAGDLYALEGDPFPSRPVDGAPLVVEAAVPPSRMDDLVSGTAGWVASIGVGLVWFGLEDGDDATVRAIHDRAVAAGGTARPIRGSVPAGTLPDTPLPAAEVQARLRSAFDPAGVLS